MDHRHGLARDYPPKPANVYLFATCLVDQFAPDAGMDTVRLLEREGIAVHFPEAQTCCGQPAYTSGYPDAALLAKSLELSARIFELTEFLVHVAGFSQPDRGEPRTVALHTSCHARREMGSHETSTALLASLDHVAVVEQARIEECCGFGGTFALRHPDISEAIVSDKVASLKDSGARHVVSADCGCLFNILGRAARLDEIAVAPAPTLEGEHIASFLWRRTGGAEQ